MKSAIANSPRHKPPVNDRKTERLKHRRLGARSVFGEVDQRQVEILRTTRAGMRDVMTAKSGTRGGPAARIKPGERVISMVERRTLPGAN